MSFNSCGQEIALDCFLPSTNGNKFPTIVGLHGSGGGHAIMSDPAELLAANGFAVYVLHYFDRTGTSQADRDTIFRHFPLWMKTLGFGKLCSSPAARRSRTNGIVRFLSGCVPFAFERNHRLSSSGGCRILRRVTEGNEVFHAAAMPGADPARRS